MPRTRVPYPSKVRNEAVRLVRTTGKPVAEIARQHDVSYETLRARVKQADIDDGPRGRLTTEETEEVRRLRREVKRLREEREIPVRAPLLRRGGGADPQVRFAVVEREKAHYAIAMLCRTPAGSASGYYAWRNRAPSARAQEMPC